MGGTYTGFADLVGTLGRLTGRYLGARVQPRALMRAIGGVNDLLQRAVPARLPWAGEGIFIVHCDARCDDSLAAHELGFRPRPLEETLADTTRSLLDRGFVSRREARKLADAG